MYTLKNALKRALVVNANGVALHDGDDSYTWSDVVRRVRAMASALAAAIGSILAKTSECAVDVARVDEDARWTLALEGNAQDAEEFRQNVADVLLLCHYSVRRHAVT